MSTAAHLFEGIEITKLNQNSADAGQSKLPADTAINAHIHLPPNFSAFDTVEQAIGLADDQRVRILGASNYYDFGVYADFARLARARKIFPLFGLEIIVLLDELVKAGVKINDPGNPGKLYVCGKGITAFDSMTSEATELLDAIRKADSSRMARMVSRLEEVFAAAGFQAGLDELAVKQRIVARHGCSLETVYLQERHVAQAFQERIFESVPASDRAELLQRAFGQPSKAGPDDAAALQNEIRSCLMKAGKPAFIEETFVDLPHAMRLILALGGIPCYPSLADGANPICLFEAPVESLINTLKTYKLHCAEFIPVRNSPEILNQYVTAMRRAGLVVTAGTEHNTRELIPLAPTCLKGEPIPEEAAAIFQEGACVVAAHQYLVARGETGYVDSRGNLNPEYADSESRIQAFRELGSRVITSYWSSVD